MEPDLEEPAMPHYRRGPFAGLSANVVRLGFVSLFADISSEMLYPILPIFLTTVLHAPVSVVGLIEGVAEATASLMKTVSGRLSDATGRRKPFVVGGYGLAAVGKLMLAAATTWPLALAARVTDRFGKGLRSSARDAWLADSASEECRGRAFGVHRGMDTLGAVIGPLIALALVRYTNDNLRLVLVLAFIPGAIAVLLVALVREVRRPPHARTAGFFSMRSPSRPFSAYLVAWGVFSLANSSDVFLILRAQTLGYNTTGVILLYVVYNIVYAMGSPYLGTLSDRIGRRRLMRAGMLVFAGVYLGFAFARHGWSMWVLFAVYGLYIASTEGIGKAYAVDLVPAEQRATALGLLGTVTGLTALVSSTVAGVLWTRIAPGAVFVYGAAGALLAAVLFSVLAPLRRA